MAFLQSFSAVQSPETEPCHQSCGRQGVLSMDMLSPSRKAYETLPQDTGRSSEQLASLTQRLISRDKPVQAFLQMGGGAGVFALEMQDCALQA